MTLGVRDLANTINTLDPLVHARDSIFVLLVRCQALPNTVATLNPPTQVEVISTFC